MRRIVLIAALAVCGAASTGVAWADEPGFLFDALRNYHFKLSWEKLIKTVDPTPDWLMNFERSYEGAAGEMTPVTVDGKPYKISYVCKPEDCVGHKFAVLFDAQGARAYGALGGKDEPPAFFGAPSAAEQDALLKALHPVAAAQTSTPKSQ
jgi:hypothetical protein